MKKQIYPLTSMRFVFCLMVFFSHLNFLKETDSPFINSIYKNIFYEGYIGVSFFFILSGFVLAYNYFDGLTGNTISVKSFYVNRFARIYPLYIATFIVAIPLLYKSIFLSPLKYLGLSVIHIFLLPKFHSRTGSLFQF